MSIFPANKANIKKAAGIIKSGGLVAFPTETVYGLGADAFNPIAVSKIFEAKNRPFFDPLIVHIANIEEIENIALEFGETEQKLVKEFWPGPLTIILPRKNTIPDIVTSGLPTVAVRMPANRVAKELIAEAGTPVAAPSANLFGHISPTKAGHVLDQLGEKADMILDGGSCEVGIESTIIKIEDRIPVLLRHGGIPIEEIEKITGKVKLNKASHDLTGTERPESPGQMPHHYSPTTPLQLFEDIMGLEINSSRAGLLLYKKSGYPQKFIKVEILSKTGDLREAAANLFSCLHKLDSAGLDIIYAEKIPETGLGKAIMDRLNKAAVRYKL